jgi:GDP-mannose transporter
VGILSCAFYTLCSISTVIANKYISFGMSPEDKEELPEMTVIMLQCLIAVVMVEAAKKMGWVEYAPFNMVTAKEWLPVNLLFIGMLCSGLISFVYVSVPMITIFKNLTNLVTVAGDWYFFNEQ